VKFVVVPSSIDTLCNCVPISHKHCTSCRSSHNSSVLVGGIVHNIDSSPQLVVVWIVHNVVVFLSGFVVLDADFLVDMVVVVVATSVVVSVETAVVFVAIDIVAVVVATFVVAVIGIVVVAVATFVVAAIEIVVAVVEFVVAAIGIGYFLVGLSNFEHFRFVPIVRNQIATQFSGPLVLILVCWKVM